MIGSSYRGSIQVFEGAVFLRVKRLVFSRFCFSHVEFEFRILAHFFRYFPFVVTTDSNNVACNFYSALALLFWSNFSGTLKNKSEQLVSNASLLARSGANEFGNKGFSGHRPLYCSIHIGLFYCVNVKHSGLNVKARQSSRGFFNNACSPETTTT